MTSSPTLVGYAKRGLVGYTKSPETVVAQPGPPNRTSNTVRHRAANARHRVARFFRRPISSRSGAVIARNPNSGRLSSWNRGLSARGRTFLRYFRNFNHVPEAYNHHVSGNIEELIVYLGESTTNKDEKSLKKFKKLISQIDPKLRDHFFKECQNLLDSRTQMHADLFLDPKLTANQKQKREEARQKAEENHFKTQYLVLGEESIGLNSENQIYQLLLKIYDMPKKMSYRSNGSSIKRRQNYTNRQIYEGKNTYDEDLQTVEISSGLPLIILGFTDFATLRAMLDCLKIPKNTKKFIANLNNAISRFFRDKDQSPANEKIVLELKQLIARIHCIKTSIDYIFEEYWRGAYCLTTTTRPRTITDVDSHGAALIPKESNAIRSFPENSHLPVSKEAKAKLSGLVPYSYSLYTYNTQDHLFRVSFVFGLHPSKYRYGDKAKRDEAVKLLGIEESEIDLSDDEVLKGNQLMCYGAFYESEKLFGKHIEKYNLPQPLQVTLMDHTIRLENGVNLLSGSKPVVFKNVHFLKTAIENLYGESKALERIYDIIHKAEEKRFSERYPSKKYPYENAALLIKERRIIFLNDFLAKVDPNFWNVRNPQFLESFGQGSYPFLVKI